VPRYWRTAPHGPRILFFTGGTALAPLSRELKNGTWNSIHIVTPFDSGGSSASIRRAFHMLSVGDLRNRLLALADEGEDGDAALFQFLGFRLPHEADEADLRVRLAGMVDGEDSLMDQIREPARGVMRELLGSCVEALPASFPLRDASIGNLVLAGGYLREGRQMATVLDTLSQFVLARGVVRPVTEEDLDLGAALDDGREIVGQHLLTGKAAPPLETGIREIFLARDGVREEIDATDEILELVDGADMIIYPMGSFFSSVLCNLLPRGVGRAIAGSDALKVYIPNLGRDPEQFGMSLPDAVGRIEAAVRHDAGARVGTDRIVNTVLLDRSDEHYTFSRSPAGRPAGSPDWGLLGGGLEVLRLRIAGEPGGASQAVRYDPALLCDALLSMA
jgi:CofD-related protein of GAK system